MSLMEQARTRQMTAAYQGVDTNDLLNHIAWTDVIKPRLINLKDQWGQALVRAVMTPGQPSSLTREQIAGRIEGISYIIGLFEDILRRGEKAALELKEFGINVS